MDNGLIFTLIASFTVLFTGVITVFHDNKSVTNKLFLFISISTIFWSMANYFSLQPIGFSMIFWTRLVLFFAVPHIIFFYFFIRNFPSRELRISKKEISIVSIAGLLVMILTLTPYVFEEMIFVIDHFMPSPGLLMPVFAIFVIILLILSVIQILIKYFKADIKDKISWRTMLLGFIISYVFLILTQVVLVNVNNNSKFIIYGPLFMLPTVIGTAYSILRYQLLNVKAIATEIIVFILLSVTLIQIALSQNTNQFIFNTILFTVFLIISIFLIKSVLHEVEQKEYLQALNKELRELVQQRESLVHLITHKVKGSFTRSKYLFAEMLEGTFGPLKPDLEGMVKKGFQSDVDGIATVDLVLNSSNLQKGIVKYDMQPTDFKEIVSNLVDEKKVTAESKGLKMEKDIKEGNYMVMGDAFWLKDVVVNLLENSIRYTKEGSIMVGLERKGKKVLLSVKDTGIGITDEDKKNLFTEGGRGKESVKVNVDSTGYGLFSVKLVMNDHNGRVWAESEGPGKGSQFYLELDAIE